MKPEVQRTHCLQIALAVFAQYALLALDISFVAAKNYAGVVLINPLIAMTGWYVTRGIVQAQTMRERTSYVIGGTAGAVAAVWLS
jgi:hypothetical protein